MNSIFDLPVAGLGKFLSENKEQCRKKHLVQEGHWDSFGLVEITTEVSKLNVIREKNTL